MPAERIGTNKGNNVSVKPMSAVIIQGTSAGPAAASNTSAVANSLSSSLLASNAAQPQSVNRHLPLGSKPVVHQVGNSLASSVAEVIIQPPVSTSSNTDGAGSGSRSITVDASLHGGATITSQMQTSAPVALVTSDKMALKRPLSGTSNSGVVTKVIITRNPSSSQPHAMPIQLTGLSSSAATTTTVSGAVSIISQGMGNMSPTKTVTISSQGIVSPGKAVIATLPASPTKVSIPVNKMPISPAKTPTKITMIPVSIPKSPQQRLAVSGGSSITVVPRTFSDLTSANSTGVSTVAKPATITMSPSKVIIKQASTKTHPVRTQTQIAPTGQGPVTLQLPISVAGSSVQQVQVPGSKFHYVRLVSPTTQSSVAVSKPITTLAKVIPAARPIAPATASATNQVKITLPVSQNVLVQQPSKPGTVGGQTVQRIILPAAPSTLPVQPSSSTNITTPTSLAPIRPNLQASTPGLAQLPPGTTLLTPSTNLQGLQGFALVPAQYVTQLQLNKPAAASTTTTTQSSTVQQSSQSQTTPPVQQVKSEYVPIASNDPAVTHFTIQRNNVNGTFEATGARPRKPCNCTKSQCLKLYCDCFANGEFCHNCNCNNCANNLDHEEERSRAIKSCLDRNPMAFHPKIGKGKDNDGNRRHNKGCNCKRSGCLKNYCECYEAKIMCSSFCKCMGCKNFEESSERKTLMHLADAAEVRVQQQTAAKTKLSSQISGIPSKPPASSASGERLPFTLITADVAEATSACLLAQAEEAERLKMPPVVQERMVIEEFGRCLMQIIESANKTKAAAAADV